MKYFAINLLIFMIPAIIPGKSMSGLDIKIFIKKNKPVMVALSCVVIFTVAALFIYKKTNHLFCSCSIALIPACIPWIAYDLIQSGLKAKEQKGITGLLMVLTKWSTVKNDAVYCLQKAGTTSHGKPIDTYLRDICIRLEKGMSVSSALTACEQVVLSEELVYVLLNIRYAYEKGGSLYSIFKNLEGQFFKIDEENYKRKISTASDKYSVYASIGLVVAAFILFILKNDYFKNYYLSTNAGLNILGLFSVLFFSGIFVISKILKRS